MVTVLLGAGLVLALVLLIALHYRLDGLPFAVWSEARRERQDGAAQALDLMKEAVAKKAGAAVLSIQQHEGSLAAGYRNQVAEAQLRSRMSDVRAGDTVTALNAATALVRELRQALDQLPRAGAAGAPLDASERVTVEIKPSTSGSAALEPPSTRPDLAAPAPADGEERPSEDDLTKVAERPRLALLGKTLVSPGNDGGTR